MRQIKKNVYRPMYFYLIFTNVAKVFALQLTTFPLTEEHVAGSVPERT